MNQSGDQPVTDHSSSGAAGKALFTSYASQGIITVTECSTARGLTKEQQHALVEVLKALDGMRRTVQRILGV